MNTKCCGFLLRYDTAILKWLSIPAFICFIPFQSERPYQSKTDRWNSIYGTFVEAYVNLTHSNNMWNFKHFPPPNPLPLRGALKKSCNDACRTENQPTWRTNACDERHDKSSCARFALWLTSHKLQYCCAKQHKFEKGCCGVMATSSQSQFRTMLVHLSKLNICSIGNNWFQYLTPIRIQFRKIQLWE